MRVNYFDLGLHRDGWELGQMHNKILPDLKINDYRIFGFEAHPGYCDLANKKHVDDRINIYNRAIADEEKDFYLYLARNSVGHSLFASKNNVSKKKKVKVKGIVFTEFLEAECPSFKDEINILKINIEGAEWYFFNDMISKGYHKHFTFCGSGHDVDKVAELDSEKYWDMINDNEIKLHRFSDYKPERNADMASLIRDLMK